MAIIWYDIVRYVDASFYSNSSQLTFKNAWPNVALLYDYMTILIQTSYKWKYDNALDQKPFQFVLIVHYAGC